MLKRIITILLAIVMVASLFAVAGCGKKPGKVNGPGLSAGSDADEEAYFMDMPSKLEGTTVKFATWIDHAKTDTATALTGFEEKTGMKYEMVQVNQDDYIVKLTALIAGDEAPDVVVENGDFPRTLKLVQPLSKETNGLDATDPFWDQNISEIFKVGQNYYFVNGKKSSWNGGGEMVYFHKTILEENGIKTPADYMDENNWNLDTMTTLLKQIKSSCGLSGPGAYITLNSWLSVFGTEQVKWDTENDKFINTLNTEATKNAIKKLMALKDEGLVEIIDNHDDGITKGSHVLQMAGAYGLRKSPGWFYEMDVDDLGFAYMPKINASDADYPASYSLRAYGICNGSKNPEGAAYFLRYFLNEAYYDVNQIFKTEYAKEMAAKLRESGDINRVSFTRGVACTVDASFRSNLIYLEDLLNATAAQVDVNLASAANKFNAAIAASNDIIDDVITSQ